MGRAYNFSTITDGLSNTVCMSELVIPDNSNWENLDVRGDTLFVGPGGNPFSVAFSSWLTPNSAAPDICLCAAKKIGRHPEPAWSNDTAAGFFPHDGYPTYLTARSNHTGVVNISMCDGSVSFISNTISSDAWKIMTSARSGKTTGN